MATQGSWLVCSRCGWTNTAGARYCAQCGEPIDPALVAELQRLYTVLHELNVQVAAGQGGASVFSLRDTIRDRYLSQRASPSAASAAATTATQPGQAAPATLPLSQPAPAAPMGAVAAPAAIAAPVAARQPHGPVFSWRAFIAEQAIAVMAYLGGFLLLIATLTFEVGGWQALPSGAKLVGVLVVYLIFGALGVALRRAHSLRTVSRVYLGVFALMTPLAALAVYRFELQARGFPVAGMTCIAAAYTAVVYLALAMRTRFVTYAYLGWAALLLAALAIPPWAQRSAVWWIAVANLMALALLAPRALWRWRGAASGAESANGLEVIAPAATQFSAGAALVGSLATGLLGLQVWGAAVAAAPDDELRAIFALAACALVPLTAGWNWTARSFTFDAQRDTLDALDWLSAASVALAAIAVAYWLHASHTALSYTLTATALAEGLAAETLRLRAPNRWRLRLGVQLLAAPLAGVAAWVGLAVARSGGAAPDYAPLLVACAAGVALGLTFALRGSLPEVTPWGLATGAFVLSGAQAAFNIGIANTLRSATADQLPGALAQAPTLHMLLALALVGVALGLRLAPQGSRLRRLRAAVAITALAGASIAARYLIGHSRGYSALHLALLALAALLLARVERRPVAAGLWAGVFGALATLVFIVGEVNGAQVAALPVALAVAMLALRRPLGRSYVMPIYVVALLATLAALLQLLIDADETTAQLTPLTLGLGGWMALVVALALALDALAARSPLWMIAPAAIALLATADTHGPWPAVALTLALAGVGALLRRVRGPGWEAAWHAAAVVASVVALTQALGGVDASMRRALALALLFTLLAWLIAWQERLPWLTAASASYALVALAVAGELALSANQRLAATFAIALLFTLLGMAARLRLGGAWALALYANAILAAGFTAARVTPYPERAGLLEALLLIFAALAFVAALLEQTPWAALAPAVFAAAAALAQPDGRALLPLALGLAATAFGIARTRGAVWSLPFYGAALLAAVASAWQGRTASGVFEVGALVTLALAAWLLAALESRADALLVSFTFATLAVSAAARAFGWEAWQATLAFAALAWAFDLSRLGWARIPWLREREGAWLGGLGALGRENVAAQAAWRDPCRAGMRIARGAAAFVGVGTVVGGWLAPDSFATHSAQTQALAVALLSLAALLTLFGWDGRAGAGWRPALYLAGEALALGVTWELRWLGADNIQAWIIAPGSAQLIIGALLPADTRLRPPRWAAQAFSVTGALILTLPTLGQSITEPIEWQWRYALLLAVEALALTLLALGLRNRLLALTGTAFVGVAAIRGAIIAVQQNLPVPIVIGVFALALMGLATWLSLRARRLAQPPTAPR